jgi:regulator of protease activity HflC (stomatin/prohibitin superfamily)
MIKELERKVISGWAMLAILIPIAIGATLWIIFVMPEIHKVWGGVVLVVDFFLLAGLFMVNPNEGRVLQLFGKYVGTAKTEGLRWANPFYSKRKISLRVRNFETNRLKVNDRWQSH